MDKFFIIFAVLALVIVLGLYWQKKALTGQQRAISHIDVSLELQRKSVELQHQSIEQTDRLIAQQDEVIRLLKEINASLNRHA